MGSEALAKSPEVRARERERRAEMRAVRDEWKREAWASMSADEKASLAAALVGAAGRGEERQRIRAWEKGFYKREEARLYVYLHVEAREMHVADGERAWRRIREDGPSLNDEDLRQALSGYARWLMTDELPRTERGVPRWRHDSILSEMCSVLGRDLRWDDRHYWDVWLSRHDRGLPEPEPPNA